MVCGKLRHCKYSTSPDFPVTSLKCFDKIDNQLAVFRHYLSSPVIVIFFSTFFGDTWFSNRKTFKLRVELRGHLSSSVHVHRDIHAVPINFQLGTKTPRQLCNKNIEWPCLRLQILMAFFLISIQRVLKGYAEMYGPRSDALLLSC